MIYQIMDIDKNIVRPGTVGRKGNIRRPDFQWQAGTPDYEIWNIKPICIIAIMKAVAFLLSKLREFLI